MRSSNGVSDSFRNRADSAAFFEAWVGMVLSRAGLYTLHHPFTLAASEADRPLYAHTWDLDVGSTPMFSESGVRCEVKSLNLPFTTAGDYPFGELLICSQQSWLNKFAGSDKTTRDFLFVSRVTGAILWLPTETSVELGHEVHDSTRNETYKAVKTRSEHLCEVSDFVRRVLNG